LFSNRNASLPRMVLERYKKQHTPPKIPGPAEIWCCLSLGCPLGHLQAQAVAGDKRHSIMSRPICGNAAVFTSLAEQGGGCQPLAGQATNKFVECFYAVELFSFYSFSVTSFRGNCGWPAHISGNKTCFVL